MVRMENHGDSNEKADWKISMAFTIFELNDGKKTQLNQSFVKHIPYSRFKYLLIINKSLDILTTFTSRSSCSWIVVLFDL